MTLSLIHFPRSSEISIVRLGNFSQISVVNILTPIILSLCACTPTPMPGPDKQGVGTVTGAVTGAGTGAIIGAQMAAGSGPGAFVGAGFGAVLGALKGAGLDLLEEEDIKQLQEVERLKISAWAQEILADHYRTRLRLYPNRDIYPSDLFFEGDANQLCPKTKILAREIAKRIRTDMPWSRIQITSYSTAKDGESSYAEKVNERRAEELAVQFIRGGIEPRRILVKAVTLNAPLVIDPEDHPSRYRQSIEIAALDH